MQHKQIILDLPAHISMEEAQAFANEINTVFQPHNDAYVVEFPLPTVKDCD